MWRNILIHLKKEKKSKIFLRVIFFVLLSIFSILLVERLLSNLVITIGKSVSYTLFLKVKDRNFVVGDYVMVKTPEEDKIAKGVYITKRVGCVGGKVLRVVGLDYYCCEAEDVGFEKCKHLGRAKLKSKKGEAVKPYNPCGEGKDVCNSLIPEYKYFLIVEHPDSYDSRYLGLFQEKDLITKLKPLI